MKTKRLTRKERITENNNEKNSKSRANTTTRPPISMSRPKPIVPRRLVAAFAICLVIVILYGALHTVIHQKSVYAPMFEKNDTALIQEHVQIMTFLNGPIGNGESVTTMLPFLTQSEQSHMIDVKTRFDTLFIMYLASLGLTIGIVIVFFTKKMWRHFDDLLARSLRAAGWALVSLCALIGLAALFNFTKFWLLFHAILFPSGNWMFAANSTLITLYPQEVFATMATRLLLLLMTTGITFLVLSWVMLTMRAHEHHFLREGLEGSEDKNKKKED